MFTKIALESWITGVIVGVVIEHYIHQILNAITIYVKSKFNSIKKDI